MKIYDISQEVFTSQVYPGDPIPEYSRISRIPDGDVCNLTTFSMCAHTGTHVDAPYHFFENGKTVDQMDLSAFVGEAIVVSHTGQVLRHDAEMILAHAKQYSDEAAKRILMKGKAIVTIEAAAVFAEEGILLIGNESQTVGPEDTPMQVHRKLLSAGVVLLEGIRLAEVPDGIYLLNAAPINLGGADGAPCRSILIEK